MGTKFNTQIANGSYVEEGTVSQTEWQNRNEQIMSYVKVSSYVNWGYIDVGDGDPGEPLC